jgi:alpha-ketoglutarate-dependent taurine dioxygenase
MKMEEKLSRFLNADPVPVEASAEKLVEIEPLLPGASMPLLVRPVVGDVDLVAWARHNKSLLEDCLLESGALLFRGFGADVDTFERFAEAVCSELYAEYGDLPKEEMGEKIYQSTPYPPDKTILFHNESSHLDRWPRKQFFHCVQAAQQGGETPIVDCRVLYRRLPSELTDRLAQKKLLYVRNFKEGLDVSWQEFFKTEDRAVVEERCRRSGLSCSWQPDGGLRLLQPALAVTEHPETGEWVFFNQVLLHHVSCLDPKVATALRMLYSEEDLPRSVCYGDGTPIDDGTVRLIHDAYWEASVAFPWQNGDILMLDNMLVAHARNPFVGPRKIVVAMGEMIDRGQLAVAG